MRRSISACGDGASHDYPSHINPPGTKSKTRMIRKATHSMSCFDFPPNATEKTCSKQAVRNNLTIHDPSTRFKCAPLTTLTPEPIQGSQTGLNGAGAISRYNVLLSRRSDWGSERSTTIGNKSTSFSCYLPNQTQNNEIYYIKKTAPGSSKTPHYRLRFEDDDNEIRSVPAELVVPCMD